MSQKPKPPTDTAEVTAATTTGGKDATDRVRKELATAIARAALGEAVGATRDHSGRPLLGRARLQGHRAAAGIFRVGRRVARLSWPAVPLAGNEHYLRFNAIDSR